MADFWLRSGSGSRTHRLRRKILLLFGEKSTVCFDSQELKNSSTQECCDADLGTRLLVLLEFSSSILKLYHPSPVRFAGSAQLQTGEPG
jgi:hypothetical protein